MRRNLRLLRVAWLLNVKQLTRSSFDGFLAIALAALLRHGRVLHVPRRAAIRRRSSTRRSAPR